MSEYVLVKHLKNQDKVESLLCLNNFTSLDNQTKATYQPKKAMEINSVECRKTTIEVF